MTHWVIPYTDQTPDFWEQIADQYGELIEEVYFPIERELTATGRSPQPRQKLEDFLRHAPLPKSVLVNPIILDRPVTELAPRILAALQRLQDEYGVRSVVVANLDLARRIKESLPDYRVGASTLMGICSPLQVAMIQESIDVLVPDSRLVRDRRRLRLLRQAFPGEMRLIVNEACLPGCPYRTQHFYEMGYGDWFPESLCQALLAEKPWLRLTGAWILPRHLHYYAGIYDSLKIAGRVTLRDPHKYLQVLRTYVQGEDILPCDMGGGPASPLEPISIPDWLFEASLDCEKNCHTCSMCRDYYLQATAG